MWGHERNDHWEHSWKDALLAEGETFDAATLANDIDHGKVEFLQRVLPCEGRAVEVGCGSARLLTRVGSAAPLILYGVDASRSALRLAAITANHAAVDVRLARADAYALPFATGSFDLVLSGGLLEHFRDPRPVMAEMVRILRPGGVFYADVVPRRISLYRLREAPRMLRSPWLAPGVYESSFGPRLYSRWLRELGCERVHVMNCGVYPWRSSRRWLRWTRRLDGTAIADALGWYFMVTARRA